MQRFSAARHRLLVGVFIGLAVATYPLGALAAVGDAVQIDTTRLEQLYAEQLQHPDQTEWTADRIVKERARIRTLIDEELNAVINNAAVSGESATNVDDALQRQRTLVDNLEARQNEAKVDLSLLKEEENRFTDSIAVPSDSNDGGLAKTYPELLARKAVLEERIAATQFFLLPQRERLQKLQWQERIAQFSTAFAVLQVMIIVAVFVMIERFIRTKVLGRISSPSRRFAARKAVGMASYILLGLWLLARLSSEFPGIITSFAIIGAGIAVALQDVVKDIVGWLTILQGRRFGIGHRISIGTHTGDVVDISPFRTTLLEVSTAGVVDIGRTGKTLYIPNASMLTEPVLNYNTVSDYIRVEQSVTITYQSHWETAKRILQELLEEKTGEYAERARSQQRARIQQFYFGEDVPGPTVYVELSDSGVTFILRYFVPIGERRRVTSDMNEEILRRFAAVEPRIDIAYKTTRSLSSIIPMDADRNVTTPPSSAISDAPGGGTSTHSHVP